MLLRLLLGAGLTLACNGGGVGPGDAAADVEDSCETYVGDPDLPLEVAAIEWPGVGKHRLISDGDDVDLIRPVQGGHVIFLAARARNLCVDEITLVVELWDDEVIGSPMATGRLAGRPFFPDDDGWALPDLSASDRVVNLNTCPNLWETPVVDRAHRLEVSVVDCIEHDGTTCVNERARATHEIGVRPVCRQAIPECLDLCECDCGPRRPPESPCPIPAEDELCNTGLGGF